MKTSKLKFLIPILAIVFAITSAFTTSANSDVDNLATIDGYIDHPSPCMTPPIKCLPSGTNVCTNDQQLQVYGKFNLGDTTCPRVVFKN